MNDTFNQTIEHDVAGLVEPGSQYTILVELVETTSGVVIDERDFTIINTTTTKTPGQLVIWSWVVEWLQSLMWCGCD